MNDHETIDDTMSGELLTELKLLGQNERLVISTDGRSVFIKRELELDPSKILQATMFVSLEAFEYARIDMLAMAFRRTREQLEKEVE